MANAVVRRLVLISAAVAGFWLYRWCSMWALGHATAIPFPSWWLYVAPRPYGIFLWAWLWHTAACILVAAPFAWLLGRLYGRVGIYLACAATLLFVGPDLLATSRYFGHMSNFARAVTVVDTVKILVVLPLLVLFLQLRSPTFVGAGRGR